ncbi:putative N-acetylgalactosaminide beta-1,3-galactosyltransferase [Heracleum sosnowskyi]|uniref:N-acetylgalactosaminide beta-1,3-galactosyltransferase n=1 Tax=Heracleum sosnowskyi TaxID=360622 RepID=A0AAD8IUC4_9APIA|nr:putative N-acetylgalactosaminide beta-1,3-galactosyltransferase [Heracleum sosnowskyi]
MPHIIGNKFKENLRSASNRFFVGLCQALIIAVLILFAFFVYVSHNSRCQPADCIIPTQRLFQPKPVLHSSRKTDTSSDSSPHLPAPALPRPHSPSTTNISHLVFGISAATKSWKNRQSYIESWWKPNVTRGIVFFDDPLSKDLLPWPPSSPPYKVSENATNFEVYKKHVQPYVIRIVRTVLELFREVKDHSGVRWYIMGDDDTVFFLDNLLEVLRKYDHRKYYYIGANSECTKSNYDFSFEMAYGGGGYALSYPLAAVLVKNLDACIDRYPYLHASDQILQFCISELGVSVTLEKGFHQLDLVDDISGFLSAHPQSPLVTLHHLDIALPIFPPLPRNKSLEHLMEAASFDESRMLQQTICYHKEMRWAFSISWGYSAHIYELLLPVSILRKPLETFTPWSLKRRPPDYMFNIRQYEPKQPCDAPHIFYFESIEKNTTSNMIVTNYVRLAKRLATTCPLAERSADYISRIEVVSPTVKPKKDENRGECCDITQVNNSSTAKVSIRTCEKDELVAP